MKSKKEGGIRFRLIFTFSLAVVLPAMTLVYVNFKHVKSIQRDKKVEALIHRDFDYILSVSEKKINEKAYALADQARSLFPADNATDAEKIKQLDEVLSKNPWFAH